ncbi:hypothetical protein Dsin_025464 [Dipteronia sinensis]|uniref:Pentatricopeptide repeat-containing protein n=1 Tax=Dipteronia sinensis TaxID=43782 RepID=A0AAD9ZW61_9ROSI|nr:hypothetical protein Dsin_025464 [Dipteronia sinensis]
MVQKACLSLAVCANDQSVPTHPVHINGFGTSTKFSTSLSNSAAFKGSEYPQKNSQVSWWSNHNKIGLLLHLAYLNIHSSQFLNATYSCILSACSHAGLIDDGLGIFKKLV